MILEICLFSIQNETVCRYVHIRRMNSNMFFFPLANRKMEIINRCDRFNSIQKCFFCINVVGVAV